MKARFLENKFDMEKKQKNELANQRVKDMEDLKSKGGSKANKNVVMPKYALDERLSI